MTATASPQPAHRPRQFTPAERAKLFPLDFTVHIDGAGKPSITVPQNWERQNLIRIGPYEGANQLKFSPRVHIYAAPVFSRFFAHIAAENALQHIVAYDGGFVPRLKRGVELPKAGTPKSAYEAKLSNHSRGTAIDLNAAYNPMGAPYDHKKHGGKGDLSRIIALADRVRIEQEDGSVWGIVCGAHWKGASLDPQHFEIGVW